MRDVSQRAPMALGYLSEVERGQKDISSELLESVAGAIDVSIAKLSYNVAEVLSDWEQQHKMKREMLLAITK